MTISEQDYLKIIYEKGGTSRLVSNKEIAEALKLSPPSVSEMIKRLTSRGYIQYEPYRGMKLTEKGREKAVQVIRRHQLWELWLTKDLGYPLHMVHEEAERLEHAMSEELEKRLFEYLGRPTHGAMGEVIRSGEDSETETPHPSCSLSACEAGLLYKISWIEDDSELLKYFEALGLKIGDQLKLIDKAPFNGPITVEVNTQNRVVGYLAAGKIHMTSLQDEKV